MLPNPKHKPEVAFFNSVENETGTFFQITASEFASLDHADPRHAEHYPETQLDNLHDKEIE